MNMLNKAFEASAPLQSDEEHEAQVFCDLDAARQVDTERERTSFVVFQYPDNRSIFQRLRAWWHLRRQPTKAAQDMPPVTVVTEPEWPLHWNTTKYL